MKYLLECCVDSTESALSALRGGADRLELCGNLIIGGTTPSLALFRQVRRLVSLPIHVLLRPRFGDFLYSEWEIEQLRDEVRLFREAGADGIVIGALTPEGDLDLAAMESLLAERGDMRVTLHRAFDMCRNPLDTMEQAICLGIDTILTSGQQNNCYEGRELFKELSQVSRGRIDLMAGSGVSAGVIRSLLKETPIRSFHMSGKKTIDSGMRYRRKEVSMGLPSFSEYELFRTDETEIAAARAVLTSFQEKGETR